MASTLEVVVERDGATATATVVEEDALDVLRARVLAAGATERVEVNQRHLIDKILARYSAEHTVYRELLQNSNDANATCATVHFQTRPWPRRPPHDGAGDVPPAPAAARTLCHAVTYTNNGAPFTEADWARLRSIAQGRPDEDKIGFFGVGFYSVFSFCENPMVVSAGKCMVFHWQGDALYTTRDTAGDDAAHLTSFVLPARDPFPVPDMKSFALFLAHSLAFTDSLVAVAVQVDGAPVLTVRKSTSPAQTVRPPAACTLRSPGKLFAVGAVEQRALTLEVEDTAAGCTRTAQLALFEARAVATLPREMAMKMERITKKKPPAHVRIGIATCRRGAEPARGTTQGGAEQALDDFVPENGRGRVYIGFATQQTTGFEAHVSLPLIPTVERESIDFVDATLRVWNRELLYAAGVVARHAYDSVMASIAAQHEEEKRAAPARAMAVTAAAGGGAEQPRSEGRQGAAAADDRSASDHASAAPKAPPKEPAPNVPARPRFAWWGSGTRTLGSLLGSVVGADVASMLGLEGGGDRRKDRPGSGGGDGGGAEAEVALAGSELEAARLMRSFGFVASTPSAAVGQCLSEGFLQCTQLPPPLLTVLGVQQTTKARVPADGIDALVRTLPVVDRRVAVPAHSFLAMLKARNWIRPLTVDDLVEDVQNRPLTVPEAAAILKWWLGLGQRGADATAERCIAIHEAMVLLVPPNDDARRPTAAAEAEADGKADPVPRPLSSYTAYSAGRSVPEHLPRPPYVLPRALCELLRRDELEALGKLPARRLPSGGDRKPLSCWWVPLSFHDWAVFVAGHARLTADGDLARDALQAMSQQYTTGTWTGVGDVAAILRDRKCIETTQGMTRPGDAYLPSVSLFDDLPCVTVGPGSPAKSFLVALGVRDHVDLGLVFARLGSLQWDVRALVKYLAAEQGRFSAEEWDRLRATPFLPYAVAAAETAGAQGDSAAAGEGARALATQPLPRALASDLLFPADDLRLPGLKVLAWPGALRPASQEGRFLSALGVCEQPLATTLVRLAHEAGVSGNRGVQDEAIGYLVKHRAVYVDGVVKDKADLAYAPSSVALPFLPCTGPDGRASLAVPADCFLEPGLSRLGFKVLSEPWRAHAYVLGVASAPTSLQLARALVELSETLKRKRAPVDECRATMADAFAFLSTMQVHVMSADWELVRQARIVPVEDAGEGSGAVAWAALTDVYFRTGAGGAGGARDLFPRVDFGANANAFLRLLGTKDEPTPAEIALALMRDPAGSLASLGTERYAAMLRAIALASADLPKEVVLRMARTPFLLALTLPPPTADAAGVNGKPQAAGEPAGPAADALPAAEPGATTSSTEVGEPSLRTARGIYIADDTILERLFRPPCAPKDTLLEEMYTALGSKHLASEVARSYSYGDRVRVTAASEQLQALLRQRTTLLLQDGARPRRNLRQHALQRLSNVRVVEVDAVVLRLTFGRETKVQMPTCGACSLGGAPGGPPPLDLAITRIELVDVARVLAHELLRQPAVNDVLYMSSILGMSRDRLRDMGFAVDRMADSALARPVKPADEHPAKPHVAAGGAGPEEDGRPPVDGQPAPPLPPPAVAGEEAKETRGQAEQPRRKRSWPRWMTRLTGRGPRAESAPAAGGRSSTTATADLAGRDPTPVPPSRDREIAQRLGEALRAGVRHCRARRGDYASEDTLVAPEPARDAERLCEVVPGHELFYVRDVDGVPVYVAQGASASALAQHGDSVRRFGAVLRRLARDVFELADGSVVIYYQPDGRTVAFNAGGTLHFNLRYFLTLHDGGDAPADAVHFYWFVILCHELAHNFGALHDVSHEHFMEGYMYTYAGKLLRVLMNAHHDGAASSSAALSPK